MSDQSAAALAIALFQRGDVGAARLAALAALKSHGESAVLRHLLGLACCREGDLAEGIAHLERAAELAPRDPQILVMLMRALIDAGRPRGALARSFEADGLASPALLALWRTRAEAAHRAEELALEAEALERVVLLDPSDRAAREKLVPMLLALDRPEACLAQLNALPRSRQGQRDRSRALIAMRRFDDAAAIEQALLEDDPRNREAWLSAVLIADRSNDLAMLGNMVALGERGRYARSEVDYARALVAKHEGRVGDALVLAEASEVPADPARRFALIASMADRLGRADEAFEAATDMAAATADHAAWRRRGAAHRARLEQLLAGMTDEWSKRLTPPPPLDRPAPAFLVGFPRSGTTLLDTFLMGHPNVVVVEEEKMLDAAAQILGEQLDLDRAGPELVERARQAYFTELDRHLPEGRSNPSLVIDKLPLAMTGAAIIHALFPGAKFIFAQRHPADAVLSNFLQAFMLNDAMANFLDLSDAAQFYDVAMRLWTRQCDLFNLDLRTLVYEELIADPAAALRPLVESLDLRWDDRLLNHEKTAAARGAIVTPSYDQVTQPLHRRAAGRWRRYAAHLEPVRALLEPWALQLGYGPMDSHR